MRTFDPTPRNAPHLWRVLVVAALALATVAVTPGTAGADPALEGTASGYGVSATIGGQDLIPPTPEASSTVAGDDDAQETLVEIPADPLAVSGTAIATAAAHVDADITSALQVNTQEVEGPYNAQGVGQIEDAVVGVDVAGEGVPLLEADVIRAEAVAVCTGETVTYSANSEVVNLDLAGEDIPLNQPVEDLLVTVNDILDQTGLFEVLNVEYNVVSSTADGISVDALRVTVLDVVDEAEVVLTLGHAAVDGVACGAAAGPADVPECSDDADNDSDGFVDEADPNCHTDGNPYNPDSYDPADDDESGDIPECVDAADNDGDQVADMDDPGCHTDGDATNPDTFDATDDREAEDAPAPAAQTPLPRTGGDVPLAAAVGIGSLGLMALYALRRRWAA